MTRYDGGVRATLLLLPLALAACSSGSSSSSSSSSGGTDGECAFSGEVGGAVNRKLNASGCGSVNNALSIFEYDVQTGGRLLFAFTPTKPIVGGQTGSLALEKVEVAYQETKSTPNVLWSSKSCTMEIETNVPAPTSVFANRHLLSGRGACPSPLEPVPPNAMPAVTLTPFEWRTFINPR